MRKHDSKWKTLIPLIVAMVVMTGVFILISYLSYRQNEIEDLENYARGLTKLIAGEIVDGDIRIPLARVIKLIRHIVICIKSTTNNYFDTIT